MFFWGAAHRSGVVFCTCASVLAEVHCALGGVAGVLGLPFPSWSLSRRECGGGVLLLLIFPRWDGSRMVGGRLGECVEWLKDCMILYARIN